MYWFRTPPGVRVGRAAIDEQAMRLLEQHNPEVEFDWPRLLRDAPQDPGARRDRDRDRDPRERDRRERRDGRESRAPQRPRPLDTTAAAVPRMPPALHDAEAEIAEERAEAHADRILEEVQQAEQALDPVPDPQSPIPESVAVTHGEPLAADHTEYVEYAEAAHVRPAEPVEPEPGEPAKPVEPAEPVPGPAAARLGADGLARLRARYVQLAARLADKPIDEETRAELKARVERLNPDAWLTADEVAAALEQYESVFESLRLHVGQNPRRRL